MNACCRGAHTINDLESLGKIDNDDHEWKPTEEAGTVSVKSVNGEVMLGD